METCFTVCNLAYLHKAIVLADSLFQNAQRKMIIYIFDRKTEINDLKRDHISIRSIEDLPINDIKQLAFKYDITEFSTSLKAAISLELLKTEANKVLFFDPDIFIYENIDFLFQKLDASPILLTPHYITPHSEADIGMMRFGSFNLGFFGVNNSEESLKFLNWWNERCIDLCYFETQFGLSTDQKWVSIAPCFFPNLNILFDQGLNAAFWNMHERVLSHDSTGKYLVNQKYRLVFFHFSSFDERHPENLTTRPFLVNKDRTDWAPLAIDYNMKLQEAKKFAPSLPYGFDYFSNGEYISPTLRRAYAAKEDDFKEIDDPFDAQGVVYRFAKRNFLICAKTDSYSPVRFTDKGKHLRKLKLVNVALKIILRILGPNKFQNFQTMLVYLSSARLNKELWRKS